jgi:hypothetical protein
MPEKVLGLNNGDCLKNKYVTRKGLNPFTSNFKKENPDL